MRKNKIYETVPKEVFQFSKTLCALIRVTIPNAILIDNDIPDGESQYTIRMTTLFLLKKDTETEN